MNKKTLKALKGSIAKWEGIVRGEIGDEGQNNCPLCHLFYWFDCYGCPVRERTKERRCRKTPYTAWCALRVFRARTPKAVAIAEKELNFLKSLLPQETER